jgi:hypothetical protein
MVLTKFGDAWQSGQRFDKVLDTQTARIQEIETRVNFSSLSWGRLNPVLETSRGKQTTTRPNTFKDLLSKWPLDVHVLFGL